jgi:mannose-1-phosphate guanylyltransferase/phosphomannomutase
MKAVIMAGGFGTRIQPLTKSVPKPMLDVVNIPMMEHILNRVIKAGIKEIVILLYFKPEVIKEYFGNGSKWGVNIEYILPQGDFGTCGAVGQAREYLENESFIIVSGDLVTDFDLSKIIEFHNNKNSLLTIGLTPVDNPLQFGVVITDKESKIIKFLEKPSWGEVFSDTINTGIYIIEPQILDYIPKDKEYDFSKDLFPKLMSEGVDLWGCHIEGYWRDVGNPQSYREVHQDILNEKINYDFEGELVEFEKGKVWTKSRLPKNINIEGSVVIDKNVRLGENVTLINSCIGKNTGIDDNSYIEESVIWHDVEIGKEVKINNAVICDEVIIQDKVKIVKGAIVARKCKIEDGVEIIKDVTIWDNKLIEKGAIVGQNVVWGDKFKANIFHKGSIVGTANIELTGDIADKIAEAFGSIFKEGSKFYISRDYHHASRMLKRFIAGGLLAVGIDVLDLKAVPANVLRYTVANDEDVVAGIHVRQSITNPYKTEITFYNEDGMLIDSKISDAVERIYFREQFRRVNFEKIGVIKEIEDANENYIKSLQKIVDNDYFTEQKNVVVDLMYGMTAEIYPKLLNKYNVEDIMLNAYTSQEKLIENSNELEKTKQKLVQMVKTLELDCGIILYPNGQKADYIDEDGYIIDKVCLLLVTLKLLDYENKTTKVYLPSWAPDFMDEMFDNIEITRGKLMGKKSNFLKKFDLIADVDGKFAFTEFGITADAIYSTLKMLELMQKHRVTLKELRKEIPTFYYFYTKIPTPSSKKGTLMRKFLEDAQGKEVSTIDGIKIKKDKNFVLMIPDDSQDLIHLYIQAVTKSDEIALKDEYSKKIEKWVK